MIYRELFPPLLNQRSTEVNCEWISSQWTWLGITTKLTRIQVSSCCYDLGAWNSNFACIHLLVRSRIAAWLIPLLRKSGWALENLVRLVWSEDSKSIHASWLGYTSRMLHALFFTPFFTKVFNSTTLLWNEHHTIILILFHPIFPIF
jgi:hypothetical protein